MAGLSLNWSKLQSKIQPKNARRKVTKKIKSIKTVTSSSTTNKTQNETPENSQGNIASALWSFDGQIKALDIHKSLEINYTGNPKKTLPGKFIAIDCEFVGVGPEGKESALARVSIVNFYGYTLYDHFVKPREKVTDWRTWVSGVTPKHMKDAITFSQAQKDTADLLEGKILVGHAVHHDLDALFLSHPKFMIRDTSNYKPFREISKGRVPSLKNLTKHFLKVEIQAGQHSSVEDARATMLLFRMVKNDFEKSIKQKGK